jgi:hypothetical protein
MSDASDNPKSFRLYHGDAFGFSDAGERVPVTWPHEVESNCDETVSERCIEILKLGLLRSTGCPSPHIPLDDARSTPQNRALVTSGNDFSRNSGGLPSAARRRRCAPTSFQPSLRLRSTVSARRPQTEAIQN